MSYFEQFLLANRAYMTLPGNAQLPVKPNAKVAIVTCMDSRLNVAQALGMMHTDVHVLRNAGGRVTEDTIRSLVISQQQLGTQEIIVLHHTDCGAQSFTNQQFHEKLKEHLEVDASSIDFLPFIDVEESVREDIALLRNCTLIPEHIAIYGAVYDVESGLIIPV